MTQPVNAYDLMIETLRQWGLESLGPDVLRYLQDGQSQDQISILIQETPAYKQRFAGNEVRRKAGLPALSPAEYLSVESSYRQIMESAGLPVGFYDQPADFAQWIGADVSPSEINSRVNMATEAAQKIDEGTKAAFAEYHGIQPSDLAAFFLDRTRSEAVLQKISRSVSLGGQAINQGLRFGRVEAERLANSTLVDRTQYAQALGTVAELAQDIGKLGSIYGNAYTVEEAASDVFFADTEARRKRQKLAGQERATFSGASGVGRSSLANDTGRY